jgi:hypothetical protein
MRKQWRCFHCDEVFTSRRWAAEHFGADEGELPACKLASHEGHLVTYIRKLEDQLARYRQDDSDVMRSIMALQCEQASALRREEEKGYERGVRDMRDQGYCADPKAHEINERSEPDAGDWDHRAVNTPLDYFKPTR